MKKINVFILISGLIILLFACQKEPTAGFITDKSSYIAGETVILTNTSYDAEFYTWTMPDGQTSSSENVNYTINSNSNSGSLVFQLEAFSKNYKKDDATTKTVTVTKATGDVIFWMDEGSNVVTVTLDGIDKDIDENLTGEPDCGESGCATFTDLNVGTYSFYATDWIYEWSGQVIIEAGVCKPIKLTYSKSTRLTTTISQKLKKNIK